MVKVLKPGFYSTVQDFGRVGFQQYGVPYSGVMDKRAASFANAILGNFKNLPVLEITMSGPKLQFSCNTAICISGADMSPKLNNKGIEHNKVVKISSGDVLSFGKINSGFRSYLAILEGFKTQKVMNSYSMFNHVTNQARLLKNDILEISAHKRNIDNQNASIKVNNDYLVSNTIHVFKGPEFDKLSKQQKEQLLSMEFTISKENNRMAYQLTELLDNKLESIITSPVLPGTIQLTPSGKLIVLLRDCQTTGGYPRVLQLKESSIDILAQKFTGQSIIFKLLS